MLKMQREDIFCSNNVICDNEALQKITLARLDFDTINRKNSLETNHNWFCWRVQILILQCFNKRNPCNCISTNIKTELELSVHEFIHQAFMISFINSNIMQIIITGLREAQSTTDPSSAWNQCTRILLILKQVLLK